MIKDASAKRSISSECSREKPDPEPRDRCLCARPVVAPAVRAVAHARASDAPHRAVPESAPEVAAALPAAPCRAASDRAGHRSMAPYATGVLGTGPAILQRPILLVPLATAAGQHTTSAQAGMESIRQFGRIYTGWLHEGAIERLWARSSPEARSAFGSIERLRRFSLRSSSHPEPMACSSGGASRSAISAPPGRRARCAPPRRAELCPESSAKWVMVAVVGPCGQRAALSTRQVAWFRPPCVGPPSCARAGLPCGGSGAPRASSRASRPPAPGPDASSFSHGGRCGRPGCAA
jgi:hypothetical protein